MPWNKKTTKRDRKRRHRREAIAAWWRAYGEMLDRDLREGLRFSVREMIYTMSRDLQIETSEPQGEWKEMRMVKVEDLQK